MGVKFSCKFTLEDIEARWQSLLYDERVSRVAQTAINNLHPVVKHNILKAVLFSDKEEDLLKTVNEAPVGNPDLKIFQKIFDEHKENFFKTRTSKCLFHHWLRLRELNLLDSQKERPPIDRFEPFEMGVDDEMLLTEALDKGIIREMSIVKRSTIRRIKKLEREVRNLQSIVDNIVLKDTVVKTESINNFATLKGGQVQYLMRSQEITFGRRTQHNFVDADIQLEGSADQVSRLQGKIALEENGQFHIHNFGRNNITVNAKPLRPFTKTLIDDQAIILMGKLSFIFEVNKPIIDYIQRVYNDRIRALQKSRRRDDLNHSGASKDFMSSSTLI